MKCVSLLLIHSKLSRITPAGVTTWFTRLCIHFPTRLDKQFLLLGSIGTLRDYHLWYEHRSALCRSPVFSLVSRDGYSCNSFNSLSRKKIEDCIFITYEINIKALLTLLNAVMVRTTMKLTSLLNEGVRLIACVKYYAIMSLFFFWYRRRMLLNVFPTGSLRIFQSWWLRRDLRHKV